MRATLASHTHYEHSPARQGHSERRHEFAIDTEEGQRMIQSACLKPHESVTSVPNFISYESLYEECVRGPGSYFKY